MKYAARASGFGLFPGSAAGMLLSSLLACLFFMLFVLPSIVFAQPPQKMLVERSTLTLKNNTITLALACSVDSEDGLRDLLKDGAVLELLVTVKLERERSWWANAEAASRTFSSVLRHDPLSRDFIVTMPDGADTKELRNRNLTRLLDESWRQLSLPVAGVQELLMAEQAEEYIALITIALQHTEIPPWLKNSSLFWSSDVVPQETLNLRFRPPKNILSP